MRETAWITTAILMAACATHAAATDPQDLPDVSVTAARYETATARTAANVTVLNADAIRESGALNVVEALRNLAGIQVRSTTGNSALAELSMRGFGENSHGRVLVLLDGRRLNRPDLAAINWLQIPLSNVERIEVVRGGSSALYGDNAVAGVINIITRKGSAEPVHEAAVDIGSYDTVMGRVGVSGQVGALGYAANGNWYDSDGYRDNGAFSSYGGGANLQYLADALTLRLGAGWQAVEHDFPGFLSKAQMQAYPRQSLTPDDTAESEYINLEGGIGYLVGNHDVEVDVAYGDKQIDSDITSWFSFSELSLETLAVTPRYRCTAAAFGHANTLLLGVDYYRDTLVLDRFDSVAHAATAGRADVTKDSVGGYVRDEFGITDSLILAAGARIERAEIKADVTAMGAVTVADKASHDGTAFDLSLLQSFAGGGKLFLRGSTVYRYPFVDEQVSYYGFGDMFLGDLDPETGWPAEIGGAAPLCDGLAADVTVFVSGMEDEIAYNGVAFRNENLDKTQRRGIEAGMAYTAGGFTLAGNYTYTDAEFANGVNEGNQIPLVPQHKASVSGRAPLVAGFAVQAVATYVANCYLGGDNANAGSKLDGYTTVDLYLRYAGDCAKGIEAYIGVENVFDEEYASLGYRGFAEDGFYPSPGATFKTGVAVRF